MSTTINIPVNVPQGYNISQLTAQLTEYARMLIASNSAVTKTRKQYKHEALSGIFSDNASEDELVEEYMNEKYGV